MRSTAVVATPPSFSILFILSERKSHDSASQNRKTARKILPAYLLLFLSSPLFSKIFNVTTYATLRIIKVTGIKSIVHFDMNPSATP